MDLERLSEYIIPVIVVLFYLLRGKKKQKPSAPAPKPQRRMPPSAPSTPAPIQTVVVSPPLPVDLIAHGEEFSVKTYLQSPICKADKKEPAPRSQRGLREAFIAHEIFEKYDGRRKGIYRN